MKRIGLIALAATTLLTAPVRATSLGPRTGPAEWIPVRDPVQRELELLNASGLADTAFARHTRPLDRRSVAAVVARARRLHPDSRDPALVRLEREFGRELVDWGYDSPAGYTPPLATLADTTAGEGGMRARLFGYADGALVVTRRFTQFEDRSRIGGRLNLTSGGLLLHLDAYAGRVVDGDRFSDQLVTGSEFIAYSENTYGSLAGHGLDVTLGRLGFAWGPGAQSLLWSAAADPITALTFGGTLLGHLRATALQGDIDASQGERIAGHRLEWFPSPRLTVGLAEAARYRSAHWEPLYVLGLLPYTWVQRIVAHDQLDRPGADAATSRNNVMAAVDAAWQARPGTVLYGQFLLDDQGLGRSGYPTRVGYQAGTLLTGALGAGRWSGRAEYSRVHRYVYSVFYGEDFIHHGKPIGFPGGPDSRTLTLDGTWAPSASWEFGIAGAAQDLGEGRLGEFFDPDSGAASGSRLSGVVERARSLGGSARFWPRDGMDFSIEATRAWVENFGHVPGVNARRSSVRLAVRLRR